MARTVPRAPAHAWLAHGSLTLAALVVWVDAAAALAKSPPARSTAIVSAGTRDAEQTLDAELATAHGLLQRGLHDLAEQAYRQVLDGGPGEETRRLAEYGIGVCAFRQGRFDQAAEVLEALAAAETFPYHGDVLAMLGRSFLELKRPREAGDAFTRLVTARPDHPLADDAAAGTVEAAYRLGEYPVVHARAVEFAARYGESPLQHHVAYLDGAALLALDRPNEAAELLERLVPDIAEPSLAEAARMQWAEALVRLGRDAEAGEVYRALADDRQSAWRGAAGLRWAALQLKAGQAEPALATSLPLVDELPAGEAREAALLIAGRAARQVGRLEEARRLLGELAEQGSEARRVEGGYWLAKCERAAGEVDSATARLRALAASPEAAGLGGDIRYDLAALLIEQAKWAEARQVLGDFDWISQAPDLAGEAVYLCLWCAYRQQDLEAVDKEAAAWLARFGEHPRRSVVAFLAAENSYLREDWPTARERLEAFIRDYPSAAQAGAARRRLGMIAYRQERLADALALLAPAAEEQSPSEEVRQAWLVMADIHQRQEDWRSASRLLERYLAEAPSDSTTADARLRLATCRRELGEAPAALAALDESLATAAGGDVGRVHLERGRLRQEAGDLAGAEADFAAVVDGGVDDQLVAMASLHRGEVARLRGDEDAAARYFATAGEKSSDVAERGEAVFQQAQSLVALERLAETEELLAGFDQEFPQHARSGAAAALRILAVARQGRREEAASLMARFDVDMLARLDSGTRAVLTYEAAWAHRAAENRPAARAAYERLLEETEADPGLRARALLELVELDLAERDFAAAVQRLEAWSADPAFATLPAELRSAADGRWGIALFETHRVAEAADRLSRFVMEIPGDPLAPQGELYLGEARQQLGQLDQAVTAFAHVATTHAGSPAGEIARLRWGEALAGLQRWAPSAEVLEDFLDRYPASAHAAQARFGLAWALENQQQYEAAMGAYAQVVAAKHGELAVRAQFQIGECLFALKQHEKAAAELIKVDILYPHDEWRAAGLYEAGRCFEALGRTEDAREQFTAVIERFASTRWAILAAEKLNPGRRATAASAAGRP